MVHISTTKMVGRDRFEKGYWMTNNLLTVDDEHRSQKTSLVSQKLDLKLYSHALDVRILMPKQYIFCVTNIFWFQTAGVQLKVFITTSYPQGYLLHNVTIDTRVIFQCGQRFHAKVTRTKCCENIPSSDPWLPGPRCMKNLTCLSVLRSEV